MSLDSGDGSEDVADFLARIKELGDKRQREDEERTRKLEEEILQGRKEREARRAERARSISPTKDSPLASSISSLPQTTESSLTAAARAGSIDRESVDLPPRQRDSTPMAEPIKPTPPPSGAGLARSGTLSWQQRPGSRGSPTVRSRPLSNVASENITRSPRSTPDPAAADPDSQSMSQKAQALEGKDPSWFKQTTDRGQGSAAYRRNQDSSELGTGNVRLPGMSREQSLETDRASISDSGRRSRSPTHDSSTTSKSGNDTQSNAMSSHSAFTSPPPLLPRGSAASHSGANSPPSPSRSPMMSPSQGRISPERRDRPISPTKGLGGFVQSAMMKRSDSVTKRVGGQQSTSLSRGDSVSRSGDGAGGTDVADTSPSATKEDGGFVKPALPHRPSRENAEAETQETKRPSTPTSSHIRNESKRWSPTKSSWLEAAINKTDSPKPKPAVSQQPGWMADLNKAKQNRGSVDMGKTTAHKEVTVGGFLRSPPTVGSPAKPSTLDAAKSSIASPKPSLHAESSKSATEPAETGETQKAETATVSSPESPITSKSKPDTPPKKDFRSSLKSRPPPSKTGSGEPAEFKNVFGNLKKTETKNFVAEDVLKNNILQGKAGLNQTGGPRPWVKKDEFKDKILAKKKEMREGTSTVNPGKVNETPDNAVPEALAKRQNMGAKPVPQKPPPTKEIPEALAKRQNISARPGSITSRPKPSTEPAVESQTKESLPRVEQKQTGSVNPAPKPAEVEAGPPLKLTRTTSSTSSSSSKLADRFNPGLAGILARGPPGSGAGSPANSDGPTQPPSKSSQPSQPSASLTHQTKSRARGPRRRAPGKAAESAESSNSVDKEERAPVEESETPNLEPQKSESLSPPTNDGPSDSPKIKSKPYLNGAAGGMSSIAASIAASAKSRSGDDGESRSTAPSKPSALDGSQPRDAIASENASKTPKSQPSSPEVSKKTAPKSPVVSLPKSPPLPGKKPDVIGRTSSISRSSASDKAVIDTKPTSSPKLPSPESPKLDKKKPTPPTKPASPEIVRKPAEEAKDSAPAKASPSKATFAASGSKAKPTADRPTSPTKPVSPSKTSKTSHSVAHAALTSFFNQPLNPASRAPLTADTQSLLLRTSPPEKIKTIRQEIWEVTSDGKKISIPSSQSHVLFENSMFLCTHTFSSASSTQKTEVYLWHGHGVSPSAIEDAQLFCRNAAKEAGGKLSVVGQGKEPSNFFEALGGIVITRRGSPSATKSARYVLCGRRLNAGHIAFDEVEFAPQALCGGFPHIVAAEGQKVYVWKGRGAGTDEIGCARLIAMDLGMGDVQEVEDGKEPEAFWKAFGGATAGRGPGGSGANDRTMQASHWTQKAASADDKYATRLFAVDVDARPKSSGGAAGFIQWARRASTPQPDESEQAREISPYTQSDVARDGITVLDSFFELFVIVGANAASKLTSLHAALLFAQEYGVLATSLQDRPFIPAGWVVLAGAPEGMKSAFRRWREPHSPTARGEVVLGLNEALGAFEE